MNELADDIGNDTIRRSEDDHDPNFRCIHQWIAPWEGKFYCVTCGCEYPNNLVEEVKDDL